MMRIALVDYGAGNLHSAQKGLERALADAGVTGTAEVTSDADRVRTADRIVLPGDGAFRDCRMSLASVPGLTEALTEAVQTKGRPFFGICVGMQLLADVGEEHGDTAGLGWLPGRVRRLQPQDARLKVPHMGWNTIARTGSHPVLDGLRLGDDGLHAFFLHAYHFVAENAADVVAEAEYGGPVTAAVAKGNVFGTQFHPEKSQSLGRALFANFLRWNP